MEEMFRRAARMRVLPRVEKMERKMFRAVRNIHTPDGIFAITEVPLVLFAIGFENPNQALRKRNADISQMERKMFKDMPRNM